MDSGLAEELLGWRRRSPYNQSTDFVFDADEKNDQQPTLARFFDV